MSIDDLKMKQKNTGKKSKKKQLQNMEWDLVNSNLEKMTETEIQ